MDRSARVVAVIAGLTFTGFGLWAFVDARSFYEQLATFPPFNRHLLHDVGAFQIGIGSILLFASFWANSLAAALSGAAIGAVFHFAAHVWDRNVGGNDSDPVVFGVVALVLILGAATEGIGRPGNVAKRR